jgi:hypothetical protein
MLLAFLLGSLREWMNFPTSEGQETIRLVALLANLLE